MLMTRRSDRRRRSREVPLVLTAVLLLPLSGCSGLAPRPLDAPGAAAPAARAAASSRPNLVVVLSDDQRWDALGAAGNPAVSTPVIPPGARGRLLPAGHGLGLAVP